MDTWTTIGEAPNYQINEEGHVRHRDSKRCLKHLNDDPEDDGPYVRLRVDDEFVRVRVHTLWAKAYGNI